MSDRHEKVKAKRGPSSRLEFKPNLNVGVVVLGNAPRANRETRNRVKGDFQCPVVRFLFPLGPTHHCRGRVVSARRRSETNCCFHV